LDQGQPNPRIVLKNQIWLPFQITLILFPALRARIAASLDPRLRGDEK
jgi:hypothetical protein